MSSSVLITGAGGQVGRALTEIVPEPDARSREALDVTDAEAVARAVAGKDVVVHLAAWTDVDGAELAPSRAEAVNDRATANVVTAARETGARVVYVSTDYVFRGDDPPYSEGDPPDPVNVYGRTKLAGERHLDPRYDLIVRTSWVYGDGRNFLRSIMKAAGGGPITVVDDQRGRPTFARDLAHALVHLIERDVRGTVHVAGDGTPCSWAELAGFAFGEAGVATEVVPIDTDTYAASSSKAVAPRPRDATLSLDLARELGAPLVDWRTSVAGYVREIA